MQYHSLEATFRRSSTTLPMTKDLLKPVKLMLVGLGLGSVGLVTTVCCAFEVDHSSAAFPIFLTLSLLSMFMLFMGWVTHSRVVYALFYDMRLTELTVLSMELRRLMRACSVNVGVGISILMFSPTDYLLVLAWYIGLAVESSTIVQSLIGFGSVCEAYICCPSGGRSKAAQAL